LFWIAGAEERHMRGLKKERVFFQLVGGSVVLTAVAAAVGMLLFQRLSVPGNWFRDIAIALLWATFIFWIDRWLVSYVPYGRLDATNDGSEPRDKGWRLGYAARFLLGLVLAFVISGPITLAVFNPEIQQQLIVNQNDDRSAAGTQIRLREDFLAREKAINGAVADAELTEKAKNEALRVAQAELDAEVAGRNGTGEGCGALCDAKTTTRDNARTEATTATTAAEQARSQARIDRAQLEADIQAAIANSDAGIAAGTGALARERALFTLLLSEPYLLARWAAFTALLLLIDLAPILFKLVGSRSSLHDFVVRQEAGAEAERVRRERETQRLEDDADHDVARLDIAEQTKLRKENIELDSEAASVDARDGQDLRIEQNSGSRELSRRAHRLWMERQLYALDGQHAEAMAALARRYGPFLQPGVHPHVPPTPAAPVRSGAGRLVMNRWILLGPVPGADRSGSGRVELARDSRDPQSGDLYVVKLMPTLSNDPAERQRAERHLRNEQRWARKANSLFVAPIVDVGDDPYFGPYLVRPLYSTTLSRKLRAPGFQPTLEFALRITKQTLRGLVDCLRNAGMIHLDIKPANIALDSGMDVLLIDFGIAQALAPTATLPLGPPDCTKWYAAQEQLRGHPQNWKSSECDVHAVCAVLYEMLTGLPPLYYEASMQGMLDPNTGRENLARAGALSHLLLTGVPIEPIVMLPWLPRELSDFIMQGLSIDATRRAPGPDVAVQNALDTLIAIENRIPRDVLDFYVGQHQVVLPWPPSGPGGQPKGGGPGGPSPSPGGPPPSSPGTQSTASE